MAGILGNISGNWLIFFITFANAGGFLFGITTDNTDLE